MGRDSEKRIDNMEIAIHRKKGSNYPEMATARPRNL